MIQAGEHLDVEGVGAVHLVDHRVPSGLGPRGVVQQPAVPVLERGGVDDLGEGGEVLCRVF